MLLRLCGFDPDVLASTRLPGLRALTWASAWSVTGFVAGASAMAVLVWACGGGFWAAALTWLFTLGVMLVLQAQVQTATALAEIGAGPAPAAQRRSRLAGTGLLMLLLLVCTQPVLIGLAHRDGIVSTAATADFSAALAQTRAAARGAELQREQVQLDALLARIQPDTGVIEAAAAASGSDSTSASGAAPAGNAAKPPALTVPLAGSRVATRRALLIGNDRYTRQPVLTGAVKDARDLERELTRLGFVVTVVTDGNRRAMELAIENYARSLRPGDISLFHFSGHGFQSRNTNFLAPVEFDGDPNALVTGAVSLSVVIETLSRQRPLASIVAIDACRSNLAGSRQDGLAAVEAGTNTYIALAAQPGQVASEAQGKDGGMNGLFTAAMLRHIGKPVDVDEMFRAVRADVEAQSRRIDPGKPPQKTWSSHNLDMSLVLASGTASALGGPVAAAVPGAATPAAAMQDTQGDIDAVGLPALPALRRADGTMLCDVGRRSTTPAGDLQRIRYTQCLLARRLQVADDLRDLASASAAAYAPGAGARARNTASVWSLYRAYWTDPRRATGWTAALTLLLGGGLLWRALLRRTHESYEAELHRVHRDRVAASAQAALESALGSALAPDQAHLRQRMLARLSPEPKPEPVVTRGHLLGLWAWLAVQPETEPQPRGA